MKLLITGAGGFLGRYTVEAAALRGHNVTAMLRPASGAVPEEWRNNPNIETVRHDLRSRKGLADLLKGIEAVVHLAASKSGDLYEQFSGTVAATENLLQAMTEAGVSRITLISSFAVYEYRRRIQFGIINEESPLAVDPFNRDEYCQTKLFQERMVRKYAEARDWRCTVLRPGVIFGRNNLWTARLGTDTGKNKWISTGWSARLPLTYVENCAEAVILASEYCGSNRIEVFNVVDGETPTQHAYIKALASRLPTRPKIRLVPWPVISIAASAARGANLLLFRGTGKMPGLLVPSRLHARCKPMRYSNSKIITGLNWKPRFDWKTGIDRSLAAARAGTGGGA